MLNFAQYRLVSFDCYGTLIDWETGILSALRPILAAHGKTIADPELLRLYSELESRSQQGEFHPYREVLQSVVRGFGKHLGFNPTESEVTFASRIARQLAALPGHGRGPRQAQTALPACGHFQRGRRSLRPHRPPPPSSFRLRNHRPAGPGVQTVSPDVQAGATADRRSARPMAARSPKRLPRRDSCPVAGNLIRLGKPPLDPPRIWRGQSRHRPARPRSPQPGNPGPPL